MKIYIPYILHKVDGFIQETKFLQEIDTENLPKKGETIDSFYEKVSFFNLGGFAINPHENKTIIGSELITPERETVLKTIKSSLSALFAMTKSIDSIDIHDRRDANNYPESFIDYLHENMERFGVEELDVKKEFSSSDYFKSLDTIAQFEIFLERGEYQFVKIVVKSINTLLASEDLLKITDSNSNHFFCFEGEDYEIEYRPDVADACSNMRHLYFDVWDYIKFSSSKSPRSSKPSF